MTALSAAPHATRLSSGRATRSHAERGLRQPGWSHRVQDVGGSTPERSGGWWSSMVGGDPDGSGQAAGRGPCSKAAVTGGTPHCRAHGGGRTCQHEGCSKPGQGGGTLHCKAHGGGKRCQHEGCAKPVAQAPGSVLCTLCLRAAQPQPHGAEAHAPSALTERVLSESTVDRRRLRGPLPLHLSRRT
jgi:hypothetical protein